MERHWGILRAIGLLQLEFDIERVYTTGNYYYMDLYVNVSDELVCMCES